MMKKSFSEDKENKIPNSNVKKKEKTSLVRVSQEAIDILKLNAVIDKVTMKEYVENLIHEDNKKRN